MKNRNYLGIVRPLIMHKYLKQEAHIGKQEYSEKIYSQYRSYSHVSSVADFIRHLYRRLFWLSGTLDLGNSGSPVIESLNKFICSVYPYLIVETNVVTIRLIQQPFVTT